MLSKDMVPFDKC